VYGKQKQGAGFGHAKVGGYQLLLRGLNPLIAALSTPDGAPLIVATQLRAGNAGSSRGAASLLAEAIVTAKAMLAVQHSHGGELVVRADSAFFGRKFIAACRRAGVRFSVTIGQSAKVKAAIQAIPDDGWVEIEYPHPIWDEDQQRFVSRAQVAETSYTAFTGRCQVTARLIVRRIPDHRKTTVDRQGQLLWCGVTTPCSPTAPSCWSRPRNSTVPTPSSSNCSPRSSTGHWRTCPPGSSTRTTPG
jgi:hypothetical protein